MSVELHIGDDGRPVCEYGRIARTVVSSSHVGEIRGIGPLIVVSSDHDREAQNLGHFGVKYWVTDGDLAHIKADNGEWVWRLEAAHWQDYPRSDDLWCAEVMLGRWPD